MTMRVPFIDLGYQYREIQSRADETLQRVASSGRYLLGPELENFEQRFATYLGVPHCVCVGSGLDALVLVLKALGVGKGDEVIVPGFTFIATWLAVTHCAARPVPVEPDPGTFNLDPRRIATAITERTRAVIAVHLFGQAADVDGIAAALGGRAIAIIEDAAQAHGAEYRGRRAGSLARAAAWSFYPTKNLGAMSDGGAVTTADAQVAARVRKLRNYGSSRKYFFESLGFNSRLDELQCALLALKLEYLDQWNKRREEIAQRYLNAVPTCGLTAPQVRPDTRHAWHLFVVRTKLREALRAHLEASGIECAIHYPVPPHRQKAYASTELANAHLPLTEMLHEEVLSLPIGPHLSNEDVDQVIAALKQFRPPKK